MCVFRRSKIILSTKFTFTAYYFAVIEYTKNTALLLGFCRRERLNEVEIGFRVSKVFDLLDLQTPVIVGNGMYDEDRFTGHVNPDRGFDVIGGLRGGCYIEWM